MRKKVLKSSIKIAVITTILAACCLDSESMIPVITMTISEAWLGFMYIANK